MATSQAAAEPTTRVVLRVIVYYAVLVAAGVLTWRLLPHAGALAPSSLDTLFGGHPAAPRGAADIPLDELSYAVTVAVAMLAAILLSLPVAWVYLLTRAKRGYQQSVVQLLIILPLVVAGIVLLVKYSLALAFSLAGIVAAVRFRNTLDDSKDAVYVFLATAIGLAAAVNLPVAAVISIGFNATVLVLWYTDFGNSPVELDGRIAERRLRRARQLARTGTFVARIDDEVFEDMTREQLEGIAERAWRRAQRNYGEGDASVPPAAERRLRVRTRDLEGMRRVVEPRLQDHAKQWRMAAPSSEDGVAVVVYHVQLKRKTTLDELLALVRAAGSGEVIDAELL
jgi:hypothetical protein